MNKASLHYVYSYVSSAFFTTCIFYFFFKYGFLFSPCVRMCVFRWSDLMKFVSHCWQTYSFSSLCILMCVFRLSYTVYLNSHCWQITRFLPTVCLKVCLKVTRSSETLLTLLTVVHNCTLDSRLLQVTVNLCMCHTEHCHRSRLPFKSGARNCIL